MDQSRGRHEKPDGSIVSDGASRRPRHRNKAEGVLDDEVYIPRPNLDVAALGTHGVQREVRPSRNPQSQVQKVRKIDYAFKWYRKWRYISNRESMQQQGYTPRHLSR
jgi:hypothetical protein